MKQLAKYLLPLCCGIALASCYGLDKEEYRELAPITVSGLDRTIYAKATETLHLDKLRVESESGQDLVYEWSYGKPAGDFPGMVDTTFISSSPTLDYAFDKAGSYVLRLRIDNGRKHRIPLLRPARAGRVRRRFSDPLQRRRGRRIARLRQETLSAGGGRRRPGDLGQSADDQPGNTTSAACATSTYSPRRDTLREF